MHPKKSRTNWVLFLLRWHVFNWEVWFPLVAMFWAFAVFALGWLVALGMSFHNSYMRTQAVYAACSGIFWVLTSVHWGLRQLPQLIDDLEKCFVKSDYSAFTDAWKRRFLSNGYMYTCALALFLSGATTVYVGLFTGILGQGLQFLPQEWFNVDVRWKSYVLLLTIGVFTSFAGGAGFSLFIVNLPFARALLKLPVVGVPAVLLAKLRPLSDFYVAGTLAWFVAVGISASIFFNNLSIPAIAFLLITSIIGLSAFIWPQIVFHIMIVRAQNQIANATADDFHAWRMGTSQTGCASALRQLDDNVRPQAMWVFDRGDLTSLLIPELVTLIVLILKSGVIGQHS